MFWSYRLATTLVIALVAASVSGCAAIEDYHYEQSQELRAWIAYGRSQDGAGKENRSDYRRGWIDGFYEVTSGGPECPPAIAPKRYWKPHLFFKNADERRYSYYDGWQDGASRAISTPNTHYLKIFETAQCPFPTCHCGNESCQSCTTERAVLLPDLQPTATETIAPIGAGSAFDSSIPPASESPMFLSPETNPLPTYETLLDSSLN